MIFVVVANLCVCILVLLILFIRQARQTASARAARTRALDLCETLDAQCQRLEEEVIRMQRSLHP